MALYLGLGSAAAVWASIRDQATVWRHPDVAEPRWFIGILAGSALGLGIVFCYRLAYRWEWARDLHREFRALLGPLGDSEIVVLAAASSIGEEMFFRGALLPAAGLVWSSAIFALLHIGPKARYLPWTISSFAAGLMLGGIFMLTGDLTGPVLAHFLVNFLNLRHVAHFELR